MIRYVGKFKIQMCRVTFQSMCLVMLISAPTAGVRAEDAPPIASEWVSKSHFQAVTGNRGMVVSDDREASEWGAEILRKGGNAIDAAVATAFALAVTRPHYGSIGGGGFMVYCPKPTAKGPSPCQSIDYREQAPASSHRDMYIRNGKADPDLSTDGALASGVPGVTAGLLLALQKYGTFPRHKLLSGPIEMAKKGFRVSAITEYGAETRWNALSPAAKAIFGCPTPGSSERKPCTPGTRVLQKDLALTLERISKLGAPGFYQGPVAEKIIKSLRAAGGIMTLEDFKNYHPKERPVISGRFKNYEIISMGPPSSGGFIVIQLLGYMERAAKEDAFKNGFGSADSFHTIAHAMGLSFADRAHYLGDPDFVKIPLDTLLSPTYLDQQWKTYRPHEIALPKPISPFESSQVTTPDHNETTHFSVIDKQGNAVAITTTVNGYFGSGFVPPGTGVVMNNQMDDFSAQPGAPNMFGLIGNEANSIAPHKRPLSSMSPTIVRDSKGNAKIAIGAEGGPRIATSVFQALFNRLYFNMTLADAVAVPRIHHQWRPEILRVESPGISFEVQSALKKKGYTLDEDRLVGKIHALERLSDGRTIGVPDARGEGTAVAE